MSPISTWMGSYKSKPRCSMCCWVTGAFPYPAVFLYHYVAWTSKSPQSSPTCQGQGVCYHVYVNSAHKWTPVDQWNITIHGTPTFKQQQRHARCGSNKATRSWIYSCQNEIRLLKENPNFSVECQHMLTYNYSLFDDDIKITTYFTILNLQAIKPTLRFLPTNCEGHSSIPKWIFRHIYYQKYSNIFVPCSSFLYCFWVTVALFCPKYFHANANISSCVYIYVQYSL